MESNALNTVNKCNCNESIILASGFQFDASIKIKALCVLGCWVDQIVLIAALILSCQETSIKQPSHSLTALHTLNMSVFIMGCVREYKNDRESMNFSGDWGWIPHVRSRSGGRVDCIIHPVYYWSRRFRKVLMHWLQTTQKCYSQLCRKAFFQ